MKTFEFSIIASGPDPEADDFETRFYDAGCDDATISFQKGHIILDFAREAESIDDAVSSAIEAVGSTGAVVNRVEPDPLVNLSEIASRVGMTRQAITQYSKGQRGKGFPAPVAKITTDSPLWDWPDVALWFFRQGKVPRDAVIEAEIVKAANRILESQDRNFAAGLKKKIAEFESIDR